MGKEPHNPNEVVALLAWNPLHWLAWLAALALAVPATRMLLDLGHFVPGGLAIETDGASGEIDDASFSLDLPMRVFNGTSQVIYHVSLWVEAYACPEDGSALGNCRKIGAFAQEVPMNAMPGSSASFSQSFTSGLPAGIPGRHLRIMRKVQGVEDEDDRERERELASMF
jgi:hypothetical protein